MQTWRGRHEIGRVSIGVRGKLSSILERPVTPLDVTVAWIPFLTISRRCSSGSSSSVVRILLVVNAIRM